MKVSRFDIPGPLLVMSVRHGDSRGFFSETWRQDVFDEAAGPTRFVQDNHSRSQKRGTLRGLHYQRPPRAQGKLVRVTRGVILDVIVDARSGSPHYGKHIAVELSDDNGLQLWVPPGFLHGFCTLVDDCDLQYKVTDYYSPEHDGAVRWDDPKLGINWPVSSTEANISAKDRAAADFAEMPSIFSFHADV